MNIFDACRLLGINEDITQSPPANLVPAFKVPNNLPQLSVRNVTNKKVISNDTQKPTSSEHPFLSQIINASYLTKNDPAATQLHDKDGLDDQSWVDKRTVLLVELSIKDSDITYNPGDSIGIYAPNPSTIVYELIDRLRHIHTDINTTTTTTSSSGNTDFNEMTEIDITCLPTGVSYGDDKYISLYELLSYKFDFVGPMKKLAILPLIDYCKNDIEKAAFKWLVSKGDIGKLLWKEYIENQGYGIIDLLRCFPSCSPPLPLLLRCCPIMRPRYYSICSSPLMYPTSLRIAISVEHFLGRMEALKITTTTTTNTTSNITANSTTNSDSDTNGNTDSSSRNEESNGNTSNNNSSSSSSIIQNIPVYRRKGLCTNYIYDICRIPYLTSVESAMTSYTMISENIQLHTDHDNNNNNNNNNNSQDHLSSSIITQPNTQSTPTTTNITTTTATINSKTRTYSHIYSNGNHNNNRHTTNDLKLRIFVKPTLTFRLPGSVGYSLILIGPGTGIAPYIGFLEHRSILEKERISYMSNVDICHGIWRGDFEICPSDLPYESNYVGQYIESIPPGDIYVYYGCRGPNDYLFEKELQSFVNDKVITELYIAMSRVSSVKEYVTHKLEANGAQLYDLLIHHNAYVYICGDGTYMAKDVYNMFMKILQQYGHMSNSEASNYIQELKLRRRYLLDIWS